MIIKQKEREMLTEEEKQFAMNQMKLEEVALNQEIEMYHENVKQAQELLAEVERL